MSIISLDVTPQGGSEAFPGTLLRFQSRVLLTGKGASLVAAKRVWEGEMDRRSSASDAVNAAPAAVDWMVTVTEPLPDCPSVRAGWERIATQSKWGEWRSESKMRGQNVSTAVVPPATEPLQAGDEYVVKIGRWMKIRCRVLESSSPDAPTGESDAMVFDAKATALGGIVRARFRFTVFREDGGMLMARGQEKIVALPFFVPSKETLESEHRHTFRDLNKSFLPHGQLERRT